MDQEPPNDKSESKEKIQLNFNKPVEPEPDEKIEICDNPCNYIQFEEPQRAKSLPNINLSPDYSDSDGNAGGGGDHKHHNHHQRGKLFLKTWLKVKKMLLKERDSNPCTSSNSGTNCHSSRKRRRKSLDDSDGKNNLNLAVSPSATSTPSPAFSFREIEEEIRRNYEELQKRLSGELHPPKQTSSSRSRGQSSDSSGREMWKLSTGQVTMTDEEVFKIVPEDFSRKFLEWEELKGFGNQFVWIERQLDKVSQEKKKLENELEECRRREIRLLAMQRDLKHEHLKNDVQRTPSRGFDHEIVENKFESFEVDHHPDDLSDEEGLATENSFAKSNTDSEHFKCHGTGSGTGSRRRSSEENSSARSPSLSAFTDDESIDEENCGLLKPVQEEYEPSPPLQPQILRAKPVHLLEENDQDIVQNSEFDKNILLETGRDGGSRAEFNFYNSNSGVFVPTKRTIFTPVLSSDEENAPNRNFIESCGSINSQLPPNPPPRFLPRPLPLHNLGHGSWHNTNNDNLYHNHNTSMSTSYGNFRRIPLASPGLLRRKFIKPADTSNSNSTGHYCLARSNSFQNSRNPRHFYTSELPDPPPPLPLSKPPPLPDRESLEAIHQVGEDPNPPPEVIQLINFGNPLMGGSARSSVSRSKSASSIRKMGKNIVGFAKGLFSKSSNN